MDTGGEITLAQIRERAYDIWERNHRPEGFEIEFWLLAERELRAERDARRAGLPVETDTVDAS
ncbi:DUF2934 domain-containing protein [uncultured Methylobacterium sp.]|uniref:DUF2934 domain-containing protein n=1 Tax=uncultured Methylobacterium sp. TaxID=157278 RepID=UPI002634AEFD|nr:DUF2934 domain-containing protein [uncultured Methylobacterium sp.]